MTDSQPNRLPDNGCCHMRRGNHRNCIRDLLQILQFRHARQPFDLFGMRIDGQYSPAEPLIQPQDLIPKLMTLSRRPHDRIGRLIKECLNCRSQWTTPAFELEPECCEPVRIYRVWAKNCNPVPGSVSCSF